MNEEELYAFAKDIQAPFHLVKETARLKRLPVVNFAAGGIATPGVYFKCPWFEFSDAVLTRKVFCSRCRTNDATRL
jgi:SOR/SNZ family